MKKIIKNIILGLTVTGAAGCSGFLDEFPDSGIAQEQGIRNMSDLEKTLVGVYSPLKGIYTGGAVLYPDIQTDLVYSVIGYTNTAGNAYLWNLNAQSGEVSSVWSECWGGISRANFLLENAFRADPQTPADSLRYRNIIGETHFMRALYYGEILCRPLRKESGGWKNRSEATSRITGLE